MAEPSYITPENNLNFNLTPANKLNDSDLNALVWDVLPIFNTQTQVAESIFLKSQVAESIFLKSFELTNFHSTKLAAKKTISLNHVSQILVDSTDDDHTKSIYHFNGSTNLTIFDGLFNPLDRHEYHPWENINVRVKDVPVLKAIQGNLPFQIGYWAEHLNLGQYLSEISGYSHDEDDNPSDGGNGNENGGNIHGNGNGNGGNEGGNGNENGGNNGGDGNADGGNIGGNGNGNGNGNGVSGIGNVAANIRIHRLDVNCEYIEIISTNIVAHEYDNWFEFALAIFVVWRLRNPNHENAPALAALCPSKCWPGCVVDYGHFAEDGTFDCYDWESSEFEDVKMLLKDVLVFEMP